MDALKQWMVCIVICAIIGAVVNIISPKGNMERVMKVAVSSFLMCAFLSPFISGVSTDISLEFTDFSEHKNNLSSQITSHMISAAEEETENETEKLLISLGVEYISVEAEADVDSENNIYIKSVTIAAYDKYSHRQRQIESNLKAMFSAEVIFKWVKN